MEKYAGITAVVAIVEVNLLGQASPAILVCHQQIHSILAVRLMISAMMMLKLGPPQKQRVTPPYVNVPKLQVFTGGVAISVDLFHIRPFRSGRAIWHHQAHHHHRIPLAGVQFLCHEILIWSQMPISTMAKKQYIIKLATALEVSVTTTLVMASMSYRTAIRFGGGRSIHIKSDSYSGGGFGRYGGPEVGGDSRPGP
jgi:hypothetical protein